MGFGKMAEKPSFALLPVATGNSEGWGPCGSLPQFEGLPYLPFGKGDKLGKAADWSSNNQFQGRYSSRHYGSDVQSVFSFSGADDASFTLVDTQKQPSKFRTRKHGPQFSQRPVRPPQNTQAPAPRKGRQNLPRTEKKWKQSMHRYATYRQNYDKRTLDPSVQVKPDWDLIQDIDINALSKLSYSVDQSPPENIVEVGNVYYVDPRVSGLTGKSERPLQSTGNVFATDSILSLLMASPRSVIPWDIVIQKIGSKVFLDKREGSKIDILSVSETAVEPPTDDKDSINSATSLSREATLINQYFARQILDESKEPIKLLSGNIPENYTPENKYRAHR